MSVAGRRAGRCVPGVRRAPGGRSDGLAAPGVLPLARGPWAAARAAVCWVCGGSSAGGGVLRTPGPTVPGSPRRACAAGLPGRGRSRGLGCAGCAAGCRWAVTYYGWGSWAEGAGPRCRARRVGLAPLGSWAVGGRAGRGVLGVRRVVGGRWRTSDPRADGAGLAASGLRRWASGSWAVAWAWVCWVCGGLSVGSGVLRTGLPGRWRRSAVPGLRGRAGGAGLAASGVVPLGFRVVGGRVGWGVLGMRRAVGGRWRAPDGAPGPTVPVRGAGFARPGKRRRAGGAGLSVGGGVLRDGAPGPRGRSAVPGLRGRARGSWVVARAAGAQGASLDRGGWWRTSDGLPGRRRRACAGWSAAPTPRAGAAVPVRRCQLDAGTMRKTGWSSAIARISASEALASTPRKNWLTSQPHFSR